MRRQEATLMKRSSAAAQPQVQTLTRAEIDRRLEAIAREVAAEFVSEPAVTIDYLGATVRAHLIDNRRFIRLMARHLRFN